MFFLRFFFFIEIAYQDFLRKARAIMIDFNATMNCTISLFNIKRQRVQRRRFKSWTKKKLMISMIENIENEKWLDNMKSCINICFLKRWTLFSFFRKSCYKYFLLWETISLSILLYIKLQKKTNFTFTISTTTRNQIFTTITFFVFYLSILLTNETLFSIFFYDDS